ncbi:MAG: peptidoglycan DD-metalloendopeptidase family protein [Paramuribaculum sp.]|nr:peptidoglycan DD-metalloendopeptidase family protein [Paramuribaculum sp.]
MRSIITFLVAAVIVAATADAATQKKQRAKRDINRVRTEQRDTKREIAETSKKITANTRETSRQLARLNALSGEITNTTREIGKMQQGVDSLDSRIAATADSIASLQGRVEAMRRTYASALRSTQGSNGAMNTLAFIFSSETFSHAWQRVRYLQRFGQWRRNQTERITRAADSLELHRMGLDTLRRERSVAVARMSLSQRQLEAQRKETDQLVGKLRSEGSSLKALLKEKERKARALDSELDKLIAEEQRRREKEQREAERREKEAQRKADKNKTTGKTTTDSKTTTSTTSGGTAKANATPTSVAAADRALTGSFESNKGRLLFPVAGRYRVVRGFGRQKHPELEHVETDNSGIDIEAVGGGKARAVFKGRVSEIFKQPGYGTIIMVRHGNYLTIYANLSHIDVHKGQDVEAGQSLGTIYPDPDEDDRSILHFELRKERTKLNPMQWVK